MGICAEEMRRYVIAPCLEHLDDWSLAAENLLLGTAAVESGLGDHLLNANHPGLGIYRITPEKHTQIWDQYLAFCPDLASKVRGLASQREFLNHPHAELTTNLSYATAIAWMIYKSSEKVLPCAEDLTALASLWQQHFLQQHSALEQGGQTGFFLREYERCQDGTVVAA